MLLLALLRTIEMETLPKQKVSELAHFLCSAVWTFWRVSDSHHKVSREYHELRTFCENLLSITKMGVVNTLHCVYLLETFVRKFPMITTVPGSAYKLIVVTLMTSNKVFDDSTYTNKTWASVTGRYVKDLNNLEREFLYCMKFSITFPLYQFEEWLRIYHRFLADNYPYAYSAFEQKDQNQLLTPPLTPEERRDCMNSNFAL